MPSITIPEIDTRSPVAGTACLNERPRSRDEAQAAIIKSETDEMFPPTAADSAAERIRQSWARMGLLLAEVADELDQLLCDEDAVSGMSVVRHERLHNLLERVRRT